jgi:hypothetical protein
MVAFDATGTVRWTVPGYDPKVATADGGVIATDDSGTAAMFDQNGSATGQMASLPVQSWTGNTYQVGSVDMLAVPMVDVALSFNPFVRGNPSRNGTAVKYVNSPMFIPGVLVDYSRPPTLANLLWSLQREQAQLFQYYENLSDRIAATHAALYPLLLRDATALRFLGALGMTNAIVGYLDHAIETPDERSARGLCFWNSCLVPTALSAWDCPANHVGTWDDGTKYLCLDDGLTPRAKVVFLAACAIDARFLAQWHLAPQGQALIVPQYNAGNVDKIVDLALAAREWREMLLALGNGSTVQEAVNRGAAQAAADGADYTWIIAPGGDGNVSFKAKSAQ